MALVLGKPNKTAVEFAEVWHFIALTIKAIREMRF